MNEITFPLKLQMKGPKVGDLQAALQLILERGIILGDDEAARLELIEALVEELAKKTYGNATRKVVGVFQEAHQLQATGAVDEATANTLNAILRKSGLLDREATPRFHIVSGEVRREDGLPLYGVRVRAVHEIKQRSIRLGEDTTDAEGRYTIRYELLPGVDSINLRVSAIGEDGKLLKTSDLVRNAKAIESIDLITPVAGKPVAEWQLTGNILLEHGLPANKIKLRLYRRDFGGKATKLDETTTLEGGEYAFSFDPGGKAASLEVRAVKGNKEIPLCKPMDDLSAETPMVLNLLGFWCVGMPVSIWMGFRTSAGPVGLWWGLVAGLAAVAVLLLWRIRTHMGTDLRRIVIDDEE